MRLQRVLLAALAACALGGMVGSALAQSYPDKAIQMVVSFPPGSGSDGVARIVAAKLGAELGQPVVVLNKPGASGIIGSEYVAKARPDGYTLFLGSASSLTFNTATFAKLPYDPVNDFVPIGMIGKQPFVIAVSPGLPVKSLAEFVALAKSKPGALTYGNTGSSCDDVGRRPAPAKAAATEHEVSTECRSTTHRQPADRRACADAARRCAGSPARSPCCSA